MWMNFSFKKIVRSKQVVIIGTLAEDNRPTTVLLLVCGPTYLLYLQPRIFEFFFLNMRFRDSFFLFHLYYYSLQRQCRINNFFLNKKTPITISKACPFSFVNLLACVFIFFVFLRGICTISCRCF